MVALLVYDRKPETLTQGQLAQTNCYSYGGIIGSLFSPALPLQDDFEYTETVEQPQCPDPYKIGSTAGRPGSRGEMVKAWEEAREKSQRVRESEISIYATKARELTAEGDHFALAADLTGLLEEHGPGVYTVILMASLADDTGDEGGDNLGIFDLSRGKAAANLWSVNSNSAILSYARGNSIMLTVTGQ